MYDLHTHTIYCDGKNTPEEMVVAAIEKGLKRIGILTHSFLLGEESWCINESDYPKFINEVNLLKDKYKSKIEVLCGIERDFYSPDIPVGFDYIIGAVHMLEVDGKLLCIDESVDNLIRTKEKFFDNSWQKLYSCYYSTLSNITEKTNCDIIAHFDLITKFNEGDCLFDTKCFEYEKCCKECIDKISKNSNKKLIAEINTGAISRGYRKNPYPDNKIIDYMKQHNFDFILTSDAHSAKDIACKFDDFLHLVQAN